MFLFSGSVNCGRLSSLPSPSPKNKKERKKKRDHDDPFRKCDLTLTRNETLNFLTCGAIEKNKSSLLQ
jgi:hypothetical protein